MLMAIISGPSHDSTQQEGLFSVKIGECSVSFCVRIRLPEKRSLLATEGLRLLVPGRRSMCWGVSC